MTVKTTLLSRSVLPTMSAAPPKRDCQVAVVDDRNRVRARSALSSSGEKKRPRSGAKAQRREIVARHQFAEHSLRGANRPAR